ncbi:MAG: hypothetical protein LBC53_03210 [Spirochaetaceae bacterium]|jgi:hypothetical protein|nr:hypothetical protein [Spirochaetaceae bacterium]
MDVLWATSYETSFDLRLLQCLAFKDKDFPAHYARFHWHYGLVAYWRRLPISFLYGDRRILEANGDLWLIADTRQGEDNYLFWDAYISLKEKLLKTELFQTIQGEVEISGLIGNSERSAPCSGRAVENRTITEEEYTSAAIGETLAASMGLSPGSFAMGFIEDCGLTIKIQNIIKTEASLKDRFYIELSLSALLQQEINPKINTIRFWFRNNTPFPGLNSNRNSPDYENVLKTISAFPELHGFTQYGISKNNTTVNKIVNVYRTNYTVIEVVVLLTHVSGVFECIVIIHL